MLEDVDSLVTDGLAADSSAEVDLTQDTSEKAGLVQILENDGDSLVAKDVYSEVEAC